MSITPSTGARYARLMGVGGYRGSRVVDNAEMCTMIDSSDEWIQQRTGIVERRWATEEETPLYMSVQSSRKALAAAGLQASEIDTVIVCTISHFVQTPSLAAFVANEFGLDGAAAFDLSAACAGFGYGVGTAESLIRSGAARHVLVIGVDKLTSMTNYEDRNTALLFADGAGAVVVGPSDEPAMGPLVWGSLPDSTDYIITPDWRDVPAGVVPKLTMAGNKVFKWAITDVAAACTKALEASGLRPDQLDALIPHQANDRITQALIRHLQLPETVKVSRDIVRMGNCSAGSVPIAMEAMYESGEVSSGQTALILAFGAGMVYAAQVVVLP